MKQFIFLTTIIVIVSSSLVEVTTQPGDNVTLKTWQPWNVIVVHSDKLPPVPPNLDYLANEGVTDTESYESSEESSYEDGDQFHKVSCEGLSRQLIGDLLHSSQKEMIPQRPMVLRCDLLLVKVKSTVEKDGIFESVVALFMRWTDKRKTWDPTKFGNLKYVTFSFDNVWTPDVAMINSADNPYQITRDNQFAVRYTFDGQVHYVPQGTVKTWCALDLKTFPFDFQMCSYELESWSLNSSTFLFSNESTALFDNALASSQWSLCNRRAIVYTHTYTFKHSSESFSRLRFDVWVRRKPFFYLFNLIFPCAIVSLVSILTFMIPPKSTVPKRMGFCMTNVLTLFFFQTMLTEEMPKSSEAITPLSDYVSSLIACAALTSFETLLTERFLLKIESKPPDTVLQLVRHLPMLWETPTATETTAPVVARKKLSKNEIEMARISKASDFQDRRANCGKRMAKTRGYAGEFRFPLEAKPTSPIQAIQYLRYRHQNIVVPTIMQFSKEKIPESKSAAKLKRQRLAERRRENMLLWEEVVTRVDCLVFIICLFFTFSLPVVLFVPSMMLQQHCPLEKEFESHPE